jgi:hypothetical protein
MKLDEATLVNEVKAINWDDALTNSNDANVIFHSLYSKLTEVIDKHVPKKEVKFNSKPWIKTGIKKYIQEKNRLFKKYLKTRSSYYCFRYRFYRNQLSKISSASKKSYYNNYFRNNSVNIKNIWKGIRELTSHKAIALFHYEIILEIKDANGIANAFNNYFSNIGEKLADARSISCDCSPMDFMDPPQINSMLLLRKF